MMSTTFYLIILIGLSATDSGEYHSAACTIIKNIIVSGKAETKCIKPGDIRLMGGRSALEGRVEVCSTGKVWNRICNDGWDNDDAKVVCRQLGLSPVGKQVYQHTCLLYSKWKLD